MTNLLDLPLDQFRGYLAEGNYPQARQDELMRAYRAQNSLSGLLDRYGEEGLEGKNVSTFFPVAGPGGMSIFDALKSGQLQTRFKDYASDALGGVLGALENPRAAYQGTLPQADYDSAAMGTAGLAMGGGGVVAGRLPDGAVAANNISELRRLANIQRFGYDPEEQPAPTSGGFDAYLSTVNPSGKRIQSENRPNLRMGDMYGMLPKSAQKVSSVGDVDIMRDGDDFYAVAYNPDVGEMDVVGYAQRGEGETDLMVVQEMQGKGVGGELQYQYRSANPTAPTGGLTEAGEGLLRNTYGRLRDDGTVNANASKSAGLLASSLPEPRNAGEAMDFEKDLFWGEKDGENFVYKKTPDLSNDLAEVVAKKLNNIDGIEADVGTSNVSASSYVNVNFGTVDADGDIEPFEEFKLRFSDHPDRYGANKTIRFDETADDIYEFDEYVETRINKENLQEMLKDGIGSVLSFGKSKAVEASKEGYLTDIELSKFLKDLEKPINANASAPVGLLAAQPSTEDELRQYLMQRGLLQ